MTLVAPAGPISLALEALAVSVAASPAFQAWVGADDAPQARNRIHRESLPLPRRGQEYTAADLDRLRPFALTWMHPEGGFTAVADSVGGTGYDFDEGGVLALQLEGNIPKELRDNYPEVVLRFENFVGELLDDLKGFSGQGGGYLAFHRFRVVLGPYISDPEASAAQGHFVGMDCLLDWGAVT